MMDMEYNRTSPFISNCLHYSSEFHPYVGEFLYLCPREAACGGTRPAVSGKQAGESWNF